MALLVKTTTGWLNPMEGRATIKRHVEWPASHPQGAGVLGVIAADVANINVALRQRVREPADLRWLPAEPRV